MLSCLILILALGVEPNHAGTQYQSSLGFSASVPPGWVALTQERMKREPDLFERLLPKLGISDPKLASSLRTEVQEGKLDVLLRAEAGNSGFVDNINIRRQPAAKLALSREVVAAVCAQLMNPPDAAKPHVEGLEECTYQEAAGHPALFMRKRGNGTTALQYQIPISPTLMLAVTAVAKSENIEPVGDDLARLVQSLEFQ